MSFGIIGRILACLGFICAIVIITYFNIASGISLIEGISEYITVMFLLWLAIIDAKTFTLPNKLLIVWLGCRTLLLLMITLHYGSFHVIINSLLGAGSVFAVFLIFYYISKRTLGGGDVKLSFVLGFALTLSLVFTAVFYALLFCGIFALVAVITKKMKKKDHLPLGPFLFIGTLTAYILDVL